MRLIAIGRPMVGYMILLIDFIIGGNKYLFARIMGKIKQNFMDLNRETAMRLWGKSFGNETKAKDFAGRIIAKGAYNDRNSDFGWNVDHVLPQSRGGATADYNLVCCHISTNDEKADSFPCFTANKIPFEIVKVQSHYEIKAKSKKKAVDSKADSHDADFYDSAFGIRCFNHLKSIQKKDRFVGTVFIRLNKISNTAVLDFIGKVMDTENITYHGNTNTMYSDKEFIVVAQNYNLPLKDDKSALLDKCVLLNTYMLSYFIPCGYAEEYTIHFRIDSFKNETEMYKQIKKIDIRQMRYIPDIPDILEIGGLSFASTLKPDKSSLFVNNLVLIYTDAGKKVAKNEYDEYTEYNRVFKDLSEKLKKEASGK